MRKRGFATAATLAVVGALTFSTPALAVAAGYGKVDASVKGDVVTLGNDTILRTWSTKDGKLQTTEIENKLGKSTFKPGEGSEEFTIGGFANPERFEPEAGALKSVKPGASTVLKASPSASSYNKVENTVIGNAIDGDPRTYWANSADGEADPWFTLDFGREVTIKTIDYIPRFDATAGYQCTGQILEAELLMFDGNSWVKVQDIAFAAGKDAGEQTITLGTELKTSQIRIAVKKGYFWKESSAVFANIAEIDAFDAAGKSLVHESSEGWTVTASSNQTGDGNGPAALIDGNTGTYWHSAYQQQGAEGTVNKMPVTVTLDRGTATDAFQTVMYRSRGIAAGQPGNGSWRKFKLYASDTEEGLFSEKNLVKNDRGGDVFKASYAGIQMSGEGAAMKDLYFGLEQECDKRFIGFEIMDGQGGTFASGAEIDLMAGEAFTSVPSVDGAELATSDLTLEGAPKVEDVQDTVNGESKTGKHVTFDFEPAAFGEAELDLSMHAVMYDGDHFMRKWVEIESNKDDVRINYIDGEHLVTGEDDTTWTVPTDAGGVVSMNRDRANLGQPIYINGMFLGSEFPETDTQIVDGLGRSRYWTGKDFARFKEDGQLTEDGKYVSWQTVCGATHSDGSDNSVIQTDFFAYITSIAKPSDFRIQYNSWFDNMMFIDDENILESFKAVDKHLNETGVRPLESYVVDDGWNNYRKTENDLLGADDIRRNGDGINKDGFWTFNTKFPEGLTPSSSLVQKLGSDFGVWIGPRGGYNYYGMLASIIQDAGNGSAAGGSIDVADDRYVTKFTEMAVDWMKKYGVNYWKWDGFADDAQYNAFQQGEDVVGFDEAHQHMYGGPNGAFHSTDLWEKWIVLFDKVWETASTEQINDLWISLTCYVNPSPWFMQWSNSVWIQCVGDRGEVHNAALTDKMNTMLTYRDACYYDFINNHEFQFPLANIYNHDPIYGKEGTGITADSMNGEEFRNYLFMQGTRGTAFWELYYSDSLFDEEKWLINADFLKWEEENFDMLRNAKWVGGTPSSTTGLSSSPTNHNPGTQEAYGFSGFNDAGDEGIISMRNPAATDQTITFKLDAGVGCKVAGTYHVALDHAYTEDGTAGAKAPATVNHGDTVTMTLKPGEVQIWHLSKDGDTTAPVLSDISLTDDATVRVQASEHVFDAAFEVMVNGEKVELASDAVTAYADQKTFDIALPATAADGAKVEVKAVAGADSVGNALKSSVNAAHYDGGVIASADKIESGEELSGSERSVAGDNGFAVTAIVEDLAAGSTILSQGDQWALGVNDEGKATFTVLGVTAVADGKLPAGTSVISGVRENNGMIKLYVDGEIVGSAHSEKAVSYSTRAAANKIANAAIVAGANATDVCVYDKYLGYDEVPASPLADLIEKIESERSSYTEESWTAAGMDALLEQGKTALKGDDPAAKQAALDALNRAYGKLVPNTVANLALNAQPTAAWVDGAADFPVTNSGSPLTKAADGAIDGNSYAIFGNDGKAAGSYMQLDLGEECRIDEVNLWRYWADARIYNGTALVVANAEDFSDAKVLYYSGDEDIYSLGTDPADALYQETAEGKKLYGDAEGDKPVTARYVRLYGHGVQNGGKENHIVELQITGAKLSADPYDIAGLKALIAQAEEMLKDEDAYTAETVKALKEAVKAAEEVIEVIEGGATDKPMSFVLSAREALESAIANMKPVETPGPDPEPEPEVNTEELQNLVDEYEGKGLVEGDYTPESWAAYAKALAAAKALLEDPNASQDDVNGAMAALKAAFDGLSKVEPGPAPDPDPEPNPDPDPEDPNKPGEKPGTPNKPGALPSTGDTALLAVAGTALAGIGVAAAGVVLAKRKK